MLLPHHNIDTMQLLEMLQHQYGCKCPNVWFVPYGEDSWCYRTKSFWLTVRRDRQGHYPNAYLGAVELQQAGLDFILAPLIGRDSNVIHLVEGLTVLVFPYIDVDQVAKTPLNSAEMQELRVMLQKLQRAEVTSNVPIETFSVPFRDELLDAIETAAMSDNCAGPYSVDLHRHMMRNKSIVYDILGELVSVIDYCRSNCESMSLTHGDISAANVLRHHGRLILCDWGTLSMGPVERDYYHTERCLGMKMACRPEFYRFYELRWILGEISEYVAHFVGQHHGDIDDKAMWRRLIMYLPISDDIPFFTDPFR